MNILGNILGAILPRMSKETAKIEAVDSLISKKENASKIEVLVALGYKYLRLALYAYMVISIVRGKITLGEILKVLAINIGN